MIDGMNLMQNENGEWEEYNNTYDVVIHCETAEEQEKSINILKSRCWIPVSERLPEEECATVLCIDDHNYYFTAVYTSEHGFRTMDSGSRVSGILAWMPLPKPYKEE